MRKCPERRYGYELGWMLTGSGVTPHGAAQPCAVLPLRRRRQQKKERVRDRGSKVGAYTAIFGDYLYCTRGCCVCVRSIGVVGLDTQDSENVGSEPKSQLMSRDTGRRALPCSQEGTRSESQHVYLLSVSLSIQYSDAYVRAEKRIFHRSTF